METNRLCWYLVRTKRHKELLVRQALSGMIPNIFVPLLRTTRTNWGRLEETVEPLFPGCIFALLALQTYYQAVQKTPGIVSVIYSGGEPSEVDVRIINEIKKRAVNDIVTLWPKELTFGERVNIADAPLRGLAAVLEGYMSGQERIALLVDLVARLT